MTAYNFWMFLCALGAIVWIATYKEPGKHANFPKWFAAHIWRKSKER